MARAQSLAGEEELPMRSGLNHLWVEIFELLWAEEREGACAHRQRGLCEQTRRVVPMV
jgi:hypothetical protein